jgi:glutaminyl-tRNA synthetase
VTTTEQTPKSPTENAPNFLDELVDGDLKSGKNGGQLRTRFPPEPNGYLHIGHAKAICLNFGLAKKFGGKVNLRFDDTNPSTEETEFVEGIQNDIRWLGWEWDGLYFASDYFEQLYAWAEELIQKGLAYVDSSSLEEMRAARGNFYKGGQASPHRDRPASESLELFRKMRAGELPDGSHVLRAKIDMAHPNQNMRDPVMYRIKREPHHRTGDAWSIYPMYDYAHGYSDAIEGVTHSICSLEFENHRPLYDWFLDQVKLPSTRPRQIEFARLNLTYTVLSKRKLQQLVRDKHVTGWDDPRMPTLAGLRRRGFTPEAIRRFAERIGVSKRNSFVDVSLLEHEIREDLNARCKRVLAVLRPLKVTLENFAEGQVETFDAPFHPEDTRHGSRPVRLTRTIYVERDDFAKAPQKGWFRLAPGAEVRLRYACFIRCKEVRENERGEVTELVCTWDPDTRGGVAKDGRKVKGTIHWVSADDAVEAEARLYDRLFFAEQPGETEGRDFLEEINPKSLETLRGCKVEPSLSQAKPGEAMQFERLGYFCVDKDSRSGALVFNRTIGLKDSWAKQAAKT